MTGSPQGDFPEIMSNKVHALAPELGWELGPGIQAIFSFALTLNGNIQNIAIADAIICAAPAVANWEMHVGRPPKQWQFNFEMENSRGQRIAISASTWLYSLVGYDDNSSFDVVFIAPDLPAIDRNARWQAGDIAVQGAIGERARIELIGDVDVVESVADDELERMTPIQYLREHLEALSGRKFV